MLSEARATKSGRYQGRAFLAAAAIAMCAFSTAKANTLFTENFNSYVGNQNANQADTGLPVAYGGSISGWTGAGGNAIHAVELATGNWAVMLYYDNSITLNTGVAANGAGGQYSITFDYGTGDYAYGGQGTVAGVDLTIELLRGDNTVLAQQSYQPGAWTSGNYDFQAGLNGRLDYTGDGTGDLRLAIFNTNGVNGAFGGSIDNIVWATPEPNGFLLAGPGLALLGLFVVRRRLFNAAGAR